MSASRNHEAELETALEDYLTRVDDGKQPDQEEFKTRYPAIAGELQEFFDNLQLIDTELANPVTEETHVPWSVPAPNQNVRISGEKPGESFPVFPGFKILSELDGGGQGIVYKAIQHGTRRVVALKVIRHGRWASVKEIVRFENEVELASKLNHPNIVKVYEGGNYGGQNYFAMEFVDGLRLDHYTWNNHLGIHQTVELFLQACDAAQYAHQHGVMHRDLKPGNILVDSKGQSRILDFGLAKPVDEHGTSIGQAVTETGEFTGTYVYAAPEQVRRDPTQVDIRSDVYALGLILYELLTKMLPYPIRNGRSEEAAKYILEFPITAPRKHRKDIPDDLDTVILKAIERDQARRYQSAGALAEDLRNFLAGRAINAKRASRWYVFRKALRRYRVAIGILTAVFVALSTFAVTSWHLYTEAVDAQLTTEARAKTVRHSQRFTEHELEKLAWQTNYLAVLKAPNVPDWVKERSSRQARREDEPNWRPLAATIPVGLLQAVRNPSSPDHSAAMTWLNEHRSELNRIGMELRTKRITYRATPKDVGGFIFVDDKREALALLVLIRTFVADAEVSAAAGDHEQMLAGMNAARLATMDAADGRAADGVMTGCASRSRLFDLALSQLGNPTRHEKAQAELAEWILQDPPLPTVDVWASIERAKLTQLVGGAAVATRDQPDATVDLDLLLVHSEDGSSPTPAMVTEEDRRVSRSVTPIAVIAAFDRYMVRQTSMLGLPLRLLNELGYAHPTELERDPAYSVLRHLLPSNSPRAFGQFNCARSATILAACISYYHIENARWPDRLEDAVPAMHLEHLIDPYTEERFGYRLLDGAPIIYSVNEDFIDDGGKPGKWGEVGTDVVFFPPENK